MSLKYEMSKTYQYRKVVKPLLERKRRARINKCLDALKDLIAEFIQQDCKNVTQCNEMHVKLEKADILEVTVNHLRKLKAQRQRQHQQQQQQQQHQQQQQSLPTRQHNISFRSGYIQAANEVSRCLASLPKVNVAFGTKLMTHLGLRLNQLEAVQQHQQQQQQQQQSPLKRISMEVMPETMAMSMSIPKSTPTPTPTTTPTLISTSMAKPLKINCLLQAQQLTATATTTTTTSIPTTTSYHLSQLHSPVSSGYASDSDCSSRSSPSIEQLNQTNLNVWRPW